MTAFHLVTLGCKVNQCEAEALAQAWEERGFRRTDDPAEAETALVSLCAVTARAVRDGRQIVRRMGREFPNCKLVVTGCAAETFPEEFRDLPGVVRVVGQKSKAELADGPEDRVALNDRQAWLPLHTYHRARAVLRVQDGCSHGCSFCIVPRTRGESRSRPPAEVLAEARRLLDAGFHELVVSGINLSHYGRGGGFGDCWDLMELLETELADAWAGKARLRLSSLEPGQLDGKALRYLASSKLACPHLHLSLQSGSPLVLARMRRAHYHPDEIIDFCAELAQAWPVFGLGADLLVGFPGETQSEFERTMALAERLPLTYAHVFPYSRRPGTIAAGMEATATPSEAKSRAKALRRLTEAKRKAFLERCATLDRVDIIVQDEEGRGVSEHYASCRLQSGFRSAAARSLVRARPLGSSQGVLLAAPIGEPVS
jgi:MiaB/RimO family radical SAM methylthiotransferase